jgi:predicted Zn-dependent protease with MMP-like domain
MSHSAAEFERLVAEEYAALPEVYREACDGLAIRIERHASHEVLAHFEMNEPNELLGLYHGIALAHKSVLDLPVTPDEVLIYREPIIAYAHATRTPLRDVVRHVLVHEIGHHFGFSDDDMEEIENRQA